jgi:hypothetical protein
VIRRLLPVLITLVCSLLSAQSVLADSEAPCSPNCTFTDPFSIFGISIPSTALTAWTGPIEDIPSGTYTFGVYGTPDQSDLDVVNVVYFSYALSTADLSGSLRFARNLAAQFWANEENGLPGWTEDANGVITFDSGTPSPIPTPEPSTSLLIGTGLLGLGIFVKRSRRSTARTTA